MEYGTVNDNRPLREATDEVWVALQAGGRAQSTIGGYKEKWTPFYRWLQLGFRRLPLVGDFTRQNVQGYLAELTSPDRPRGALCMTSLRDATAAISAIAGHMHSQQLTGVHRLAGIPRAKASEDPGRTLLEDELRALFERADGITQSARLNLALLAILTDVGPRVSELVALDATDVDFDAGWISLEDPAKRGLKRILPLGRVSRRLLRDYLGKRRNGPLLTGRGGMRLTDDAVRSRLVRLSVAADVDRVSPHDFRRTAATLYEAAGASEVLRDKVFGWRPRSVAGKHYLHLTLEQIAARHLDVSPLDHLNPLRRRRDRAA